MTDVTLLEPHFVGRVFVEGALSPSADPAPPLGGLQVVHPRCAAGAAPGPRRRGGELRPPWRKGAGWQLVRTCPCRFTSLGAIGISPCSSSSARYWLIRPWEALLHLARRCRRRVAKVELLPVQTAVRSAQSEQS
jgi:hypothetical protein